jgi:hypothetical protein
MRLPIIIAATVALTLPAFAQPQGRPRPPGPPPPQAQPAPPAPPAGFFPCRTANEICFVAIAMGGSRVQVIFTNHQQSDAASAQPMEVRGPAGPLDLTPNTGRAVMLVGNFDGRSTLNNAQVVDVASPLTSFALKNAASGDDSQGDDQQPPPPPPGRPAPRR